MLQHYCEIPETQTHPQLGETKYYDLHVNGKVLKKAAWYFPEPSAGYDVITDRIAFRTLDVSPSQISLIFSSQVYTLLGMRRRLRPAKKME